MTTPRTHGTSTAHRSRTADRGPDGDGRPLPQATTGLRREGWWYRLTWRTSYALLQAYGPAQLSAEDDPSRRMRTERANRRNGVGTDAAPVPRR